MNDWESQIKKEEFFRWFFAGENNRIFTPRFAHKLAENEVLLCIKNNVSIDDFIQLIRLCDFGDYEIEDSSFYETINRIKFLCKKYWFNYHYFICEKDLEERRKFLLSKVKERKNLTKVGYIYIIESSWLYKIGYTKNIDSRTKKYTTENPNETVLIHYFKTDDCTSKEKEIHTIFSKKRKKWEWFKLDKQDLSYLLTFK